MDLNPRLSKVGFAAAGLVVGVVLAGSLAAHAASSTPSPGSSTGSSAVDPHPGDNGADGVPEAQEHHGRGGRGLDLTGTVTAVGTNTVTIKTSKGTTTYSVTSNSDIDKSGEAALSSLAVGDAVRFSVDSANSKQIDKLHAGDEAKNLPQGNAGPTSFNGA